MSLFKRWWDEIMEMVGAVVLTPWVAEIIFRRSMWRAGGGDADSWGIPKGGKKGDALFKQSNDDWDVAWEPSGPYAHDMNEYPGEWHSDRDMVDAEADLLFGAGYALHFKDVPQLPAVEPVPTMDFSFAHINQPLRSGVDHSGDELFVRMEHETSSARTGGPFGQRWWTYVRKRENADGPTTALRYKLDPVYTKDNDPTRMAFSWPGSNLGGENLPGGLYFPYDYGCRSLGRGYSPTAMRIQGYLENLSDDAWFELMAPRWFADAHPDDRNYRYPGGSQILTPIAHLRRIHLPAGSGYYDSGWMEFVPYGADSNSTSTSSFPSGHFARRTSLKFHDFVQGTFQFPFLEVQLRTYEFTDTFDWMYPRGFHPR